MITIVLADDHQIVRQGLRTILDHEHDLSVVAEASNGLEAVQRVEEMQPDVLVTDLLMPGLNGMGVTRQVRQRFPDTNVVILSMHSDESYVLEALRNGATGYVLKDSSASYLVEAVRNAATGRHYLSDAISERAIEAYVDKARKAETDAYDTLTAREQEILQLTVEGNTSAQVAEILSISPRTVETHRRNLMGKLNLRNQADLIRYAYERGLLATNHKPYSE